MANSNNQRPKKPTGNSPRRPTGSTQYQNTYSNRANGKPMKYKKQQPKGVRVAKAIAGGFGKTVLALFLVFVIVGCIAATALTVFVMKYVEADSQYDLHNVQSTLTSRLYVLNAAGEEEVIRTMAGNGRRDWVDIEDVPQVMQDAMVCAEDKTFMEHRGVEWMRTFAAFADLATGGKLGFKGGASTITQQVVKNINGDINQDTRTPSTKLKEILASLNVEKHYTKPEILNAYLNLIAMGKNNYGVQAAAQYYFNKNIQDVTLVEAASIACITKSPNKNNPIDSQVKNKERRDYVLNTMLEEGKITQEEHAAAVAVGDIPVAERGQNATPEDPEVAFGWYDDAVLLQVQRDLMSKYNYDAATAEAKIKGGGLQIYSAEDTVLQQQLEEQFADYKNFNNRKSDKAPDAAMAIMDYDGFVKATVGSRQEKTGVMVGSTATTGLIRMGSCMKPIVAYAPALQENRITWSTEMVDEQKAYVKDSDSPKNAAGNNWPGNWNDSYSGKIPLIQALYLSKNTIPVGLMKDKGVEPTLQWLENDLGFTSIVHGSDGLSTALGNMTKGVKLDEFLAAYTMVGNNGKHQTPKYYRKVVDASGKVLLEADTTGKQVIDTNTAYILNRMMRTVVTAKGATGTGANLDNIGIEVVGKTGTTENTAVSFVGLTPYHVSAVWMGDPKQGSKPIAKGTFYKPQVVWKNIMGDIYADYPDKDFSYLDSTGVVEKNGGYYKEGVTE